MANITLKIDDKLLENIRLLARKKKTSINAIIKERSNSSFPEIKPVKQP